MHRHAHTHLYGDSCNINLYKQLNFILKICLFTALQQIWGHFNEAALPYICFHVENKNTILKNFELLKVNSTHGHCKCWICFFFFFPKKKKKMQFRIFHPNSQMLWPSENYKANIHIHEPSSLTYFRCSLEEQFTAMIFFYRTGTTDLHTIWT